MDETVRLTYTQIAKARGITLAAARRLALRQKWRKQIGNDRLTHVWVPVSALPSDGGSDDIADGTSDAEPIAPMLDDAAIARIAAATSDATSGALADALSDLRSVVPALQDAILSLRVQLMAERDRADRAERELRELRAQRTRRRWWRWRP